jgi:peptidoglycan/xylan/chitin deacetylase (PgdA/CDA1 family)
MSIVLHLPGGASSPPPSAAQGSPLRQSVRRFMSRTLPRRLFLTSLPEQCGGLGLTFDDGPHPEVTPAVLDILKRLEIRATFFVIGMRAQRYPEIVRRIVEEGHAIGNHTFRHGDPAKVSAQRLAAEVTRTQEIIRDLTGRSTRLFRPPHGKLTLPKLLRLWAGGQQIVLWNVDPKDYACHETAELATKVKLRPPRSGDIVLLHDNVAVTLTVLPDLVQAARARGLTFLTLDRIPGGVA